MIRDIDWDHDVSGRVRPGGDRRSDTWVLYMHGFGSSQQGDKAEFFRQRCLEVGLAFDRDHFGRAVDIGHDSVPGRAFTRAWIRGRKMLKEIMCI